MRLRRFNESIEELDESLIKSFLNYLEDEIPTLEHRVYKSIFKNENEPPSFGNYSDDCTTINDYEPDMDISGIGWVVEFDFQTEETLTIKETNDFIKIISFVSDISKRINSGFDCKCYLKIMERNVVLIIRKEIPTMDDYYDIFMQDISFYANDTGDRFESCSIEKIGNDFYLTLVPNKILVSGLTKKELKDHFDLFIENEYEPITYEKIEFLIDKSLIRLKNPRIKNLKFKI